MECCTDHASCPHERAPYVKFNVAMKVCSSSWSERLMAYKRSAAMPSFSMRPGKATEIRLRP
jgi:hypothetical protein